MGNFASKLFSKLTSTVLNLIVVALSSLSILSCIILPSFKVSAQITFTEEIANFVAPEKENPSNEDEIIRIVANEMVKEMVNLNFEISLSLFDTISCSLDGTNQKTRDILYSFTDSIAQNLSDDVFEKVELSVAKAGVAVVIKNQIEKLSSLGDTNASEVMENIGVDSEYISQKTQSVLDSIKEDGANVDSVTDTIMSVIDDVDDKIQNSEYKDTIGELDDKTRAELKEKVEEIISSIADENGEIDGESLIATLLSGLVYGNGENEASVSPSSNVAFSPQKPLYEQVETENQTSAKAVIQEKLREFITDEVVKAVKIVFIAIALLVLLVAGAWAFLIVKILLKLHSQNPLIKLKAPISISWLPFVLLFAIPNVAFKLLSNPPQILLVEFTKMGLETYLHLVNAIDIAFASSTVLPFAFSLILLVFGVFYSARRKSIDKSLRKKKGSV